MDGSTAKPAQQRNCVTVVEACGGMGDGAIKVYIWHEAGASTAGLEHQP